MRQLLLMVEGEELLQVLAELVVLLVGEGVLLAIRLE